MMSNWKSKKIGMLGKVITGKTPSTEEPDNFGGQFPFITIPDLDNRVYITDSERTLSDKGASKVEGSRLPADAVMMSCIATIGKCGITTKPSFTNQQINSVICNKDVDSRFLYYVFTQIGHKLEAAGGGGSVYTNVSKSRFSDIEVQIPPLSEQRAIADVLSALDNKIDLNHRMNQTLESLAQAIFKHMFLDNPERESWEDGEVKDLGVIVTGKTPSTFDRDFYNGDIPFVTIPDMHGNVFILETGKTLSEKGENSQKNKTLPPFSICVSCIATPGLVSITTKRSQTNQQINSIIPYYHSLTYYCYYALKDLSYEIISRGSGGSVVINLNKGQFELLPIKIPPKQFIEKFDNLVSPIFLKLLNNQKEIITLADLRDTLLPKLMSGQVRVRDVIASE